LHEGVITGTQYPEPLRPLGLVTYLVKAIDSSSPVPVESENAAVLVVDLGAVPVENVVLTQDLKAAGFPGTVVGGTIDGSGNLVGISTTAFWSGSDTRPFWTGQNNAAFWAGMYSELLYRFSILPSADQMPSDLSLDFIAQGETIRVEHATSGLARFWSGVDTAPFWSGLSTTKYWSGPAAVDESGWLPIPGKIENKVRQVYEFRIRIPGGPVQPSISRLLAVIDVPDLTELVDEIEVPVEGVRLPLVSTFRTITSVEAALKADGSTAVGWEVVDHDINGPLMHTFDKDRVSVAGTLDWARVKGF
jgi:hypothetical protein